jgi:hypothetical protein
MTGLGSFIQTKQVENPHIERHDMPQSPLSVVDTDYYPDKMIIIRFKDGYRAIFTFKTSTSPTEGVESVEVFDWKGLLVASYQRKHLDLVGHIDKLSDDFNPSKFADRWRSAKQHLWNTRHPARSIIAEDSFTETSQTVYPHPKVLSSGGGSGWRCVTCQQTGTNRDGDRPDDKSCVNNAS